MLVLLMSNHDSHEQAQWRGEVLARLTEISRNTSALVLITSDIRHLLKHKFIITRARISVMPKTIQVGQTSTATISAQDQNGQPIAVDSTYQVSYSSSNSANVSFGTVNPDGSCVITGVAADPSNSIAAVITRPDGGTVSATPDTLSIVPVPPPTPVLTTAAVVLT